MKIAIIGAGQVGTALGERFSKLKHEVVYGVNQPNDPKHQGLTDHAQVTSNHEAIQHANLIFLATPWHKTQQIVTTIAEAVAGKILVDCTNPINADLNGLTVGHNSSGAEQIQQWAPQAKVIKALNTTGFNIMKDPILEQKKTVMFVAGDDDHALQLVTELVEQLGFDAVSMTGLAYARLLEPLALLWVSMAYQLGLGRDFGFAIVKR